MSRYFIANLTLPCKGCHPVALKLPLTNSLFCIQPGVASVYCTIVQQTKDGVEFYLKRFPELEGKTFQEARRRFDDAVLCGYVRQGEDGKTQLHINCEDTDVLQERDRVIALSQDGGPFLYQCPFILCRRPR